MNRKIEFRGIRKDNLNKFVYGFLMSPEKINSINEGAVEVMPKTVGQYTGLKDCNGVKIFEGDKVKCSIGAIIINYPFLELWDKKNYGETFEVIGNIHE